MNKVLSRPLFRQAGGPILPPNPGLNAPPANPVPMPPAMPPQMGPAMPPPAMGLTSGAPSPTGQSSPETALAQAERDAGTEMEQVGAEYLSGVFSGIDSAETAEDLINALRGDDRPIQSRYQELAMIVGPEDASNTPDSVLALAQPGIMLAMPEVDSGVGMLVEDLASGAEMVTPEGAPTDMGQGVGGLMMAGAGPMDPGTGPMDPEMGMAPQRLATGGPVVKKFENGLGVFSDGFTPDPLKAGLDVPAYQRGGTYSEKNIDRLMKKFSPGRTDLKTTYTSYLPVVKDILGDDQSRTDYNQAVVLGELAKGFLSNVGKNQTIAEALASGVSPAVNVLAPLAAKTMERDDKIRQSALKLASDEIGAGRTFRSTLGKEILNQMSKKPEAVRGTAQEQKRATIATSRVYSDIAEAAEKDKEGSGVAAVDAAAVKAGLKGFDDLYHRIADQVNNFLIGKTEIGEIKGSVPAGMQNLTKYKIAKDLDKIIEMDGLQGITKDVVLSYFNPQRSKLPVEDIAKIHSILRKTDLYQQSPNMLLPFVTPEFRNEIFALQRSYAKGGEVIKNFSTGLDVGNIDENETLSLDEFPANDNRDFAQTTALVNQAANPRDETYVQNALTAMRKKANDAVTVQGQGVADFEGLQGLYGTSGFVSGLLNKVGALFGGYSPGDTLVGPTQEAKESLDLTGQALRNVVALEGTTATQRESLGKRKEIEEEFNRLRRQTRNPFVSEEEGLKRLTSIQNQLGILQDRYFREVRSAKTSDAMKADSQAALSAITPALALVSNARLALSQELSRGTPEDKELNVMRRIRERNEDQR